MNIVERTFAEVLEKIGDNGLEEDLDWPKPDFEEIRDGPDVSEYDESEDGVFELSEGQLAEEITDRIRPARDFGPSGLGDDEKILIEGGVRVKGIEALAFYKSKRFQQYRPCIGKWGIFYLKPGLTYLAKEIAREYPTFGNPKKLALDFLRSHEFFHFKADLQTLFFESVKNRNLYRPLHAALSGRKTHFVEEALANREVIKWANSGGVHIGEFAHKFCKLQPNAYANFDLDHFKLKGEWLSNTLDLLPPYCEPRLEIASWMDSVPNNLLRKSLCPQYVVYPQKLTGWISPAWRGGPIKNMSIAEQ